MNNSIPQVKTVKLMFVAMDEQQQAMFKMAFKMHSTTNYQVIGADSAVDKPELVIVDADSPMGVSAWHKAKTDYPKSVVVFFSKNPPNITAPYLSKPIKFDTLFLSLRNLMQGNGVWVAHPGANNAVHSGASQQMRSAAPNQQTPVQQMVQAAQQQPAAQPQRAVEVTIPRFDPRLGVLGKFRELLAQPKDTVILFENKPVLAIFPNAQRVWVPDSNTLQQLCRQENPALTVKAIAEDSPIVERANATITSCMWQVAVWTANGRLAHPLNPNTLFHLRGLPNLTRLAPLPESMRLSAFLTKTTVSLNMLYKMMPLEMSDILNYIAATYLTDYLVITQQAAESTSATATQAKVQVERPQPTARPASATRPNNVNQYDDDDDDDDEEEEKPKKSGLLSRLMKKLLNK